MADEKTNEDELATSGVLPKDLDNRVDLLSRQQLIDLHELTCHELFTVADKMAAVSGVLVGLAEGYDQLCRSSSFGRLGRAIHIDSLIKETIDRNLIDKSVNVELVDSHSWKGLLGSQIDQFRYRGMLTPGLLVSQHRRLHDLPLKVIQLEITRVNDQIAVYRKRIAVDDVRVRQMALNWVASCRFWRGFRYLLAETILRDAIVDYRIQ